MRGGTFLKKDFVKTDEIKQESFLKLPFKNIKRKAGILHINFLVKFFKNS